MTSRGVPDGVKSKMDDAKDLGVDDEDKVNCKKERRLLAISVINSVKLLVFIDMLSVAIVVPLLSSYFKDLSISTELYGLMSSAYSFAQILGGLVLGALSDNFLSRRSVLLLSFLGSCLSYGLVGLSSSLSMLLVGRVIVGLVKQTMNISTALISDYTTSVNRSGELSQLTAAATFSFIVGPSLGSFLYQRNRILPPMLASSLFLLNAVLALLLLPAEAPAVTPEVRTETGEAVGVVQSVEEKPEKDGPGGGGTITSASSGRGKSKQQLSNFTQNFRLSCKTGGACMRILAAKLLYGFLMRSLSSQNLVGYFEGRFQVESYALGYISSYQAILSLIVQLYLVGRITRLASEASLVGCSLVILSLSNAFEARLNGQRGLAMFLLTVVPTSVVANSLLGTCLQSLFTQRTLPSTLGAALGTLSVLQSAVAVIAPLYGGELLERLGLESRPYAATAHYALFAVLWYMFEIRTAGCDGVKAGRGKRMEGSNKRKGLTPSTTSPGALQGNGGGEGSSDRSTAEKVGHPKDE